MCILFFLFFGATARFRRPRRGRTRCRTARWLSPLRAQRYSCAGARARSCVLWYAYFLVDLGKSEILYQFLSHSRPHERRRRATTTHIASRESRVKKIKREKEFGTNNVNYIFIIIFYFTFTVVGDLTALINIRAHAHAYIYISRYITRFVGRSDRFARFVSRALRVKGKYVPPPWVVCLNVCVCARGFFFERG